jgi:hypothetical protein
LIQSAGRWNDGMSDEPKKVWIIGTLLPLLAASFGGLLIIAAYDFWNDTPLSALPHHIFIFPGLGVVNGAVLVGSLFGAGLLLIAVGALALLYDS